MKKILLTLFVGLIGFINFGYCLDYYDPFEIAGRDKLTTLSGTITSSNGKSWLDINITPGNYCYSVGVHYVDSNDYYAGIDFLKYAFSSNGNVANETMYPFLVGCLPSLNLFTLDWGGGFKSFEYIINLYSMDNPKICSQYTSLECQQEYNLIPISSVDQNYCTTNGLCPSGGGDCPVCPGSGDNWSALYINDIQHLGKPIINITFPDYLDWDYTTNENEFNLDIVGYPVDTEYIDGIIRTQNYKPTSEDFTQLVGMLAPYSKYLLFLLFIFIIWAWIKKPFKSKKL